MIYSSFIQQGKLHRIHNTVCQDFSLAKQEGDIFFIGVADGAGSRPYSHYGSQTVLQAAYQYISTHFETILARIEKNDPAFKKDFTDFIQQAVKEEIPHIVSKINVESQIDVELSLNDLHTTLVIYATNQQKAFAIHVGDGMIVGLNKDYQIEIISEAHNGEYANSTYFVTMESAERFVRFQTVDTNQMLAVSVMSDGGSDLFFNPQEQKIIPGFYRTLIDLVDNQHIFEEKFNRFLKNNMPPYLTDDFSIAFLVNEMNIDKMALKNTYQSLIDGTKPEKVEVKSKFNMEDKIVLLPLLPQAQRDRSNALNPKHFSYYTSRGYPKKEAVQKASSYKGFKPNSENSQKKLHAIQHVCSSCLSSNIEKVVVNVLDENQKFMGEYVAKRCLDCEELTILYKVNKS